MVGHQALIIWRHNRTIEWCWLDDEWICGKMHGWGRDEKFENAWVWKWMGLTREARYRVRCSWNDSRTNQYENVAQTLWLIHYESCWVKILFSIWLYMSFWIYSAFGLHSFFLRLKMAKLTNQKASNYHKGHCDKEVIRHIPDTTLRFIGGYRLELTCRTWNVPRYTMYESYWWLILNMRRNGKWGIAGYLLQCWNLWEIGWLTFFRFRNMFQVYKNEFQVYFRVQPWIHILHKYLTENCIL